MSEHAEAVAQKLESALDRLGIQAVFGAPVREGETTLIPVAEATLGFGFGYGSGPVPKPGEAAPEDADDEALPVGDEALPAGQVHIELDKKAAGGAAGGGGRTRPLGYIQIDAEGVRFEPIEDETRMGLAGMAMVGWCVFWIAAAVRAGIKRRG